MLATESQARTALNTAQKALEKATAAYADARNQLRQVTGEMLASDQRVTLQFSTADGASRTAQFNLTDC